MIDDMVSWNSKYCLIRFGFFIQAEDGIRDLVRSRGLGDVYKRQVIRYGISSFCKKAKYSGGAL